MTKQDRAKLLALCDELEQLAAKATPGPWSVESCGEKGDGSNMVGVAFGPDDSKCERQLSGWLPPFDDDGEDIEYYRDELIADCEHSNRNSNFDAQYIAACDPQSISTLTRALKHFLEAAPHRYGSATLDDMAELDAAPALQEDLAHHAVSPTADDGTRVGLQSLPPVATPPAAVTDAMIDEARSGCPEFFRDAMYQGQAACAQRRREVSRTITHEQRVSFYHAQQVFMRERDRIQQEIDTRTTKLEAIEIGLTTLDNMLGDYKVKP